ncbi:MAG: threonine/serine exporter family protein [Oscillospiraceae bacterium]
MDRTKYPQWFLVATYTLMGFCWGGKAGVSGVEMIVCAIACFIQGLIVTGFEKMKLPTYICRFCGVLFAGVVILYIGRYVEYPSGVMTLFVAMILPVAAGAMLVEGMYTSHTPQGKKKMLTATLCSLALGLAIFIALKIMEVPYA